MTDALLIFVKYPQPGSVKTRLAKSLGEEHATAIYRLLTAETLAAAQASGFPVSLFYTPADERAHEYFAGLAWPGCSLVPQQGGDLGERMANAFANVFQGQSRKAVLIGSDTPGLSAGLFQQAFAVLDKSDSVIGPSPDGGYYLIGFNRDSFRRQLFENMIWSTEQVLRQTREKLASLNLSCRSLVPLNDIDTLDDLRAWYQQASPSSPLFRYLETNVDITRH